MYPVCETNRSGWLQVSPVHQIYWEESGSPTGKPVIFLHGGPGAGAPPVCRSFFNPEIYRIIIIDQRGCGRSTPYACVEDNTTWDLVADIEKVRDMLDIGRWLVFGGSWGSTLALAYAQTHPERVAGLILRGIFLCCQHEIDWLNEAGGASRIYPEQWQQYIAPIAVDKRNRLVRAYHELLFGDDEQQRLQAAKAWEDWESYLVQFEPEPVSNDAYGALAIARIENHYFMNLGWLEGGRAILANIAQIRDIPAVIVQGRYDMCTPMHSAWALYQAWPQADLRIVQGGHAATEGDVAAALVAATDRFASAYHW
ncbi:prolyl aminopeptidase [Uruburuella testudinis]|uniref:Proline iminopeptidase n=1 Tax=Uruburuella testudinis TaxID=1282863 RepID=A0ABY4DU67_9NEIS|nr:prolyl aminopeptidase [Uruburuella testudinis]UOO81162.1 prolyl aminopeptidase [Uruburuella testudinis]